VGAVLVTTMLADQLHKGLANPAAKAIASANRKNL